MRRPRLWLVMLSILTALSGAVAQDAPREWTFRIQLSIGQPMRTQDWSGRAEVSDGEILRVEKDSGNQDKINEDGSWAIVHGRSLRNNPDREPTKKSIYITVRAPGDAVLSLTTEGGDFGFRLDEVPAGGLERLDGNVRITAAQPPARGGGLGPATVAGEVPAEPVSDPTKQCHWPAVAVTGDGAVWVVYVQWNGVDADRIVLRRKPADGDWGDEIPIDDGCFDHYAPTLAARGDGVIAIWSAQDGSYRKPDGNFELYACEVMPPDRTARPERLTRAPHADLNARAVSDARGDVTLVWQSFREGNADIFARRLTGDTWGPEVPVAPGPWNDWEPNVALDEGGTGWISWDTYRYGNYDVRAATFDGTSVGDDKLLTSEPTAQFHSSVAVLDGGFPLVAWDEAEDAWGKDFSRAASDPGSRGLHYARQIRMRVYREEKPLGVQPDPAPVMTGRMSRYAELPQLAFDGAGTLWLIYRHWTQAAPTEMYHTYATQLTDEGWSTPVLLGSSNGLNTVRVNWAKAADGSLLVTYAGDARAPDTLPEGPENDLTNVVHLAKLPLGEGSPELSLAELRLPPMGTAPEPRVRATTTIDGKEYTLLLGDCHRHTDIRGHGGVDGSILDSLRYAYDAARLDFMGFGDHNQVEAGRWPDGLRDYGWWWTQKAVDLFHCPPTFLGVYSYEHSLSRPAGHRNMLFLRRGAPMRICDRKIAADNQPPALWEWIRETVLTEPAQRLVVVPHTFASGPLADWNWPNPEFDCLLEIYQGCRGSYEYFDATAEDKRGPTQTDDPGHFAQDALNAGNRYGFVSFSDHGSTHNSWAGVWVEDVSREAVFDALLARRTYAASDEILLDVAALNDAGREHPPGADVETEGAFSIRIACEAMDEVRRIDVIKDGEFVWTADPEGLTFEATYSDNELTPGEHYYYVRVLQRDPDAPEGDPEMAWASPFFVRAT